jgi:hypothetical protein
MTTAPSSSKTAPPTFSISAARIEWAWWPPSRPLLAENEANIAGAGPIIEQALERVHHGRSPQALVEIGRDIECAVLARAVRWHAKNHFMMNGSKTVVFA